MGRKKKYTAKELEKRVAAYFASITRTVTIKEKVEKKDDRGRTVFEWEPVHNDAGEEIKQVEYVVPPTVAGLTEFLKIDLDVLQIVCSRLYARCL